ncbi:MAG: sugar-transfer associated ATP-grasp domain-containing protein [Anaerolineales bacterium]|jgi:alpha-L-glutamate ligase-like protein
MAFLFQKGRLPSRRGVLGINGRNLELLYTHNDRRSFVNVDDKLLCKRLLASAGIPTPTTYHVVTGPKSLPAWRTSLEGVERFVVKPNRGYGGNGVMLFARSGSNFTSSGREFNYADVEFHVLQICNGAFSLDNISDTAYFEETLENHEALAHFIDDQIEGIADVRLIFRGDQPVMAMVRIPTRESGGRANLHQGGIGIGIDLDTGRTVGGCYRNTVIEKHPETGCDLRDVSVPGFSEMLEYGARISEIVGLGYIGIDFACDYRYGPLVIEVNARPGLNIQIANQVGLRRRLR